MSIRQLKALRAIAEQGSFAAAAKALNLTQSAVSMQVAALERALGTALFDRTRRPPKPTRAGEVLLERARAVVAQYDEIFEAVGGARPFEGSFRLAVIPTVLTNLLPAALMALRAEQPGLTVNVSSDLTGELIRHVAEDEVDAALIHKPPALAPGLAWRDVAVQRVVMVAPPGSTEEAPRALFAAHPYIRFNRAARVAPLIEARLHRLAIAPEMRAEIQSIEAIHLLVSLGFGVSVLPDVGPGSGGPPIRVLDFGDPPVHRTIGLLSREDSPAASARRFIGDAFVRAAGEKVLAPAP